MKTIRVVAAIIKHEDKIFATQRGYGDFKMTVANSVIDKLKPIQDRYKEILENKEYFEIEVDSTKNARDIIVNNPDLFDDFEVIKGKMDNVFLNVTGKDIKEVI